MGLGTWIKEQAASSAARVAALAPYDAEQAAALKAAQTEEFAARQKAWAEQRASQKATQAEQMTAKRAVQAQQNAARHAALTEQMAARKAAQQAAQAAQVVAKKAAEAAAKAESERLKRRKLEVREYKNAKEYERDAQKRVKQGWQLDNTLQNEGHANIGRTAGKAVVLTALVGPLGLLAAGSRTNGKITVTWVKQG